MTDCRDFIGYGKQRPHARWPNDARIAVQFVLNYEEGGENCVLNGDEGAETFLSEIVPAPHVLGARHMSMESIYEYGSRIGVWRILNFFEERGIPLTIFAVAMALEQNPQLAVHLSQAGHEVAGHGYRWIDYQNIDEAQERAHLLKAIEIITRLTGTRPLGWYTGRTSPNTHRLVAEEGGFRYSADDYSDDLPFWDMRYEKHLLTVPYTLDNNDMRFAAPHGFSTGDQFYSYLKDAFDTLYEEGEKQPAMMSVGLHCRIIGRSGRFAALKKFVDYVHSHEHVWLCRRIDIANHWATEHPVEKGIDHGGAQ